MTTWEKFLKTESKKTYFQTLKNKVAQRYGLSLVYPPKNLVMECFRQTPFEDVKVVIVGQEPSANEGKADGLAFSIPDGEPMTRILRNIFTEIYASTGTKIKRSGNLDRWAKQGVLLLNNVLTVQRNKPGSHESLGWKKFTDNAIKKISDEKTGVVFMLWGHHAYPKEHLIDIKKHAICEAPYPDVNGNHMGFSGCNNFREADVYLSAVHGETIDWS